MIRKELLFASMLLLFGCSKQGEVLFENIPESGWEQQDWVSFTYTHRLPQKEVALNWVLRHDNDYPFANIHLIASWQRPKGEVKSDTLTYLLAEPNGRWLGKGFYIVEHQLPFVERYLFHEPGTYTFKVRPAVRATDKLVAEKTLPGIHQIGIAINPLSND